MMNQRAPDQSRRKSLAWRQVKEWQAKFGVITIGSMFARINARNALSDTNSVRLARGKSRLVAERTKASWQPAYLAEDGAGEQGKTCVVRKGGHQAQFPGRRTG